MLLGCRKHWGPLHPTPSRFSPCLGTALTSNCFLRGLRSLTILAFLAGFFSSRSLSPSPLEELAEGWLLNLQEEASAGNQPHAQKSYWGQGSQTPRRCFSEDKNEGYLGA